MLDFQSVPSLEAALENRHVEVAEELLRRGCEINTGMRSGFGFFYALSDIIHTTYGSWN